MRSLPVCFMSSSNFAVIFYFDIDSFPFSNFEPYHEPWPLFRNIWLLTLPLSLTVWLKGWLSGWLRECVWDEVLTHAHILHIVVRCCTVEEFKISTQSEVDCHSHCMALFTVYRAFLVTYVVASVKCTFKVKKMQKSKCNKWDWRYRDLSTKSEF